MISRFRHRAEVLAPEEIPDEGGGVSRVWRSSIRIWVAIDRIDSITDDIDASRNGVEVLGLRIRKNNSIGYKNRLKIKETIYRITSIVRDFSRREFWDIEVEEVQDV